MITALKNGGLRFYACCGPGFSLQATLQMDRFDASNPITPTFCGEAYPTLLLDYAGMNQIGNLNQIVRWLPLVESNHLHRLQRTRHYRYAKRHLKLVAVTGNAPCMSCGAFAVPSCEEALVGAGRPCHPTNARTPRPRCHLPHRPSNCKSSGRLLWQSAPSSHRGVPFVLLCLNYPPLKLGRVLFSKATCVLLNQTSRGGFLSRLVCPLA